MLVIKISITGVIKVLCEKYFVRPEFNGLQSKKSL